jgi:hypothetical protein
MKILKHKKHVSYRQTKILLLLIALFVHSGLNAQFQKAAQTPPMGWNSYDSYGITVKENEVLENAGVMETHLKSFGWNYIVIDGCWYYPYPAALNDPSQLEGFIPWLTMDKYGRLLPAVDRFPSSKSNKGFKALADEIHDKGLKFGIHIMRGIPRQAVASNTRIKGTNYFAKDIADTTSRCTWLNHMYGINMNKPGAQEYYNSLFELYAKWGVDFIKADDISSPFSEKEIIAVRKAIALCGRPMVLSLSPGETPLAKAEIVKEYADMWRISNDFWDSWDALQRMFGLLHSWENHIGQGHFPDADMLNIGILSRRGPVGEQRRSNFNRNELTTLMTLWCIARSPLMYGGDLSMIRPFELQLLQNRAVLSVNQNSSNNRQLFRNNEQVAWIADVPGTNDKYLALFNLGENGQLFEINLKQVGLNGKCRITDLWTGDSLGEFESSVRPEVLPHGARLFRISTNLNTE